MSEINNDKEQVISSALVIKNELENKLQLSKNYLRLNVDQFSKNYPKEIRDGMNNIIEQVNNNVTLPDLYNEILEEVSVGQSTVQSQSVQMEQHFTPHRKMRQVMLELDGKLGALDTAKNGCKNTVVKIHTLKEEIESLQEIYNELESSNVITYDLLLLLSVHFPNLISTQLLDQAIKNENINSEKLSKLFFSKVKSKLGQKIVKFDEAERGLKSHQHMVKDAAFAAYHLQSLVDLYKKEIEETGWSFEMSEIYYYVMYFTSEGEKQIRTGGRVDTGTFGVVCCLPFNLQKKIQENWNFIKKQHFKTLEENEGIDTFIGYYWQTYKDLLEPKQTGEDEFEGVKLQDFINVDVPKLLTKKRF